MTDKKLSQFNFEISLSVLNHLGRGLYRNFITVIGEAISNSWDADASNVWIDIDKDNNRFVIKDDGVGMSEDDFQNKFLKIGYSKRKSGDFESPKKRPYIGRKGIGKLALLSCAKKVSIITKKSDLNYVGGTIDNSDLDKAITDDIVPKEYPLGEVNEDVFTVYKKDHQHGTIIYFEDVHNGIKNRLEYIKTLVALYFRFSLIDKSFNIIVNGEKITEKNLNSLSGKTQFLWVINRLDDPFFDTLVNLKNKTNEAYPALNIKGFIASVEKPSHLKIQSANEKIGIDLFVNGRLREKDILSHMPDFSARIVSSYLYGQIHYDQLDKGDDPFTTSRESVREDNIDYVELIKSVNKILGTVSSQWDELRIKNREDGDPENIRISPKERAAKSLVNLSRKEFNFSDKSENKEIIKEWFDKINNDAEFNTSSYVVCFLSENLIRRYIKYKKIKCSKEASDEIKKQRDTELNNKKKG